MESLNPRPLAEQPVTRMGDPVMNKSPKVVFRASHDCSKEVFRLLIPSLPKA
jgi:hypothetical protein